MKDNGGPAFPQTMDSSWPIIDNSPRVSPGMTLRDWFAGMALQGMMAQSPSGLLAPNKSITDTALKHDNPPEYFAVLAYSAADAMLAERNKE